MRKGDEGWKNREEEVELLQHVQEGVQIGWTWSKGEDNTVANIRDVKKAENFVEVGYAEEADESDMHDLELLSSAMQF